jgi:two-component system chemotaxis response regulator CheY
MSENAPILVIEDDAAIQKSIRTVLTLTGRAVLTADNGRFALEVLAREPVALVLLDMKMPDMDGWAFVREYRARADNPAPIVVVSAARDAATWAAEVGAVGCLAKPFEIDDLLDIVDRHLQG